MKAKIGELVKQKQQTEEMINNLNVTIATGSKQIQDELVTILSENEKA